MDFDDYYDDEELEFDEFTTEQLEWHANIFNFINSNNILYIPDQHLLI